MLALLATLLLAHAPAAQAADTLVRTRSSLPVAETVTRLRVAAESRGLTIFAVVDHAANARQAELSLPPTTLVLLGNPRAGTLLMHCDPAVAVDLPLRMLVWQDAEARTWIGHQPVSLLRARYRLESCGEVLERIEGVLEALRREAAGGQEARTGDRGGALVPPQQAPLLRFDARSRQVEVRSIHPA